jgi:hypothetical protein
MSRTDKLIPKLRTNRLCHTLEQLLMQIGPRVRRSTSPLLPTRN